MIDIPSDSLIPSLASPEITGYFVNEQLMYNYGAAVAIIAFVAGYGVCLVAQWYRNRQSITTES